MTISEATNFYKEDKKEYIITNNKEFLKWFNHEIKNGYCAFTGTNELEHIIDTITNWYEFKFPERQLEYFEGVLDLRFEQIKTITKSMDFEQLIYRLPHNELELITCGYRSCGWGCDSIFMSIKNKRPNLNYDLNYIDRFLLNANPNNGQVEIDYYIKKITDKTNITLDELLVIFKEKEKDNWDYSELSETVLNHKIDLELRKRILELAALKLLYSRNTIPERGYKRAKSFIIEFNRNIPGLNLSTNQIDAIIQKDYNNQKKYF